jgi:hypothetical protein
MSNTAFSATVPLTMCALPIRALIVTFFRRRS